MQLFKILEISQKSKAVLILQYVGKIVFGLDSHRVNKIYKSAYRLKIEKNYSTSCIHLLFEVQGRYICQQNASVFATKQRYNDILCK